MHVHMFACAHMFMCVCAHVAVGVGGKEQQLTTQKCISAQKALKTITFVSCFIFFWDPLKVLREVRTHSLK